MFQCFNLCVHQQNDSFSMIFDIAYCHQMYRFNIWIWKEKLENITALYSGFFSIPFCITIFHSQQNIIFFSIFFFLFPFCHFFSYQRIHIFHANCTIFHFLCGVERQPKTFVGYLELKGTEMNLIFFFHKKKLVRRIQQIDDEYVGLMIVCKWFNLSGSYGDLN